MKIITAGEILETVNYIQSLFIEKAYFDKSGKSIVQITDDFIDGHCHDFAIALHRMFGYRIGLIKGDSHDEQGNQVKHLFHAFAIDNKKQAYDVGGKYNVSGAVKGYQNTFRPDNISFNVYDSEDQVRKKLWTIKIDEGWIKRAYKRIAKDMELYFDESAFKKIKSVPYPEVLIVDQSWNALGDKYDKISSQIEKSINSGLNTRYKGWHFAEPHMSFDYQYSGGSIDFAKSGKTCDFKAEIHFNDNFVTTDKKIANFKVAYKEMDDKKSLSNIKQFYKGLTDFINKNTETIFKSII